MRCQARRLELLLTHCARIVSAVLLLSAVGSVVYAQDAPETAVYDSIAVEGARRVAYETVVLQSGLAAGVEISFPQVQRAIRALYFVWWLQLARSFAYASAHSIQLSSKKSNE